MIFFGMILFDLDPISYVAQHTFVGKLISGPIIRLSVFLTCYTINNLGMYELARMINIGFSSVLFAIQCHTTALTIFPLFLTKIGKLYDLHVLIMWYKCFQIEVSRAQFVVRNTISVGLLGCNTLFIVFSYTLIRLHNTFSAVVLLHYTICFMCIALVVKFGWGRISNFATESGHCLAGLVHLRTLRRIKTVRERRLHCKVVKAMRPIQVPVGIMNYTFFHAKQSNELLLIMYFVDNTISLLLVG